GFGLVLTRPGPILLWGRIHAIDLCAQFGQLVAERLVFALEFSRDLVPPVERLDSLFEQLVRRLLIGISFLAQGFLIRSAGFGGGLGLGIEETLMRGLRFVRALSKLIALT